MTNGKDNAFATLAWSPEHNWQGEEGLTKREYFAGLAMQGLLAQFKLQDENGLPAITYAQVAEEAIYAADALIDALNKEAK